VTAPGFWKRLAQAIWASIVFVVVSVAPIPAPLEAWYCYRKWKSFVTGQEAPMSFSFSFSTTHTEMSRRAHLVFDEQMRAFNGEPPVIEALDAARRYVIAEGSRRPGTYDVSVAGHIDGADVGSISVSINRVSDIAAKQREAQAEADRLKAQEPAAPSANGDVPAGGAEVAEVVPDAVTGPTGEN
jgi:hypothetical protein